MKAAWWPLKSQPIQQIEMRKAPVAPWTWRAGEKGRKGEAAAR